MDYSKHNHNKTIHVVTSAAMLPTCWAAVIQSFTHYITCSKALIECHFTVSCNMRGIASPFSNPMLSKGICHQVETSLNVSHGQQTDQ